MFGLFVFRGVDAQKKTKHTKFYHKMWYSRTPKAEKQCHLLIKKKHKKPKSSSNQSLLASMFGTPKPKSKPMAEVDPNDRPPPPPPVVKPQPIAKKEPAEDIHSKAFEDKTIEEHHQIENEVLAKNNLTQPTSAEHEDIRQRVARRLKTFKGDEPIELEPLFFIYDDSEFSVVDMEPFLVAVEYALQGRMILIEGHTDNRGRDDYNVKLSIQRVEKIRQLMHDMGVPDDRISVVGYGEEEAGFNNDTEEGRQKNRRVDFKVF